MRLLGPGLALVLVGCNGRIAGLGDGDAFETDFSDSADPEPDLPSEPPPPPPPTPDLPPDPPLPEPALGVAGGGAHTCVLSNAGEVRCWGQGYRGQLGYGPGFLENVGDDELASVPGVVQVDDNWPTIAISLGISYSCVVLQSGLLRCWGGGAESQLGIPGTEAIGVEDLPRDVPPVDLGEAAVQVATGRHHTCALTELGSIYCWGQNRYGELGYAHDEEIGDDEQPSDAGPVVLGAVAVEIAVGDSHSCARTEEGGVRCWGHGGAKLGLQRLDHLGDDEHPATESDVELGEPALALALGDTHTCALLESGAVRCWGAGSHGRLGLSDQVDLDIGDDEPPTAVPPVALGEPAIHISAGENHSCAVLESGAVRCWGDNNFGPLGYGHQENVGDDEHPADEPPIEVGGRATSVACGSDHTCVVLEDSAVRCWGSALRGQLGYGDEEDIGDDEHPASAGDVPYQ